MRIQSGVTDQYIYFVGALAGNRVTGLATWTVYRSRDGGAAAAMTTPTINETDSTNMKGVYELLLDEDMTIGSGNDSEAMVFHITEADMDPVTIEIELYRPKITAGETVLVDSSGRVDVGAVGGTAQTANDNGADINSILIDTAEIGTDGAGLTNINLPNQTMDITGNLSGSVGSVTNAVGSVAGNVDGNVTGSVGSNLELGPAEVNTEVDNAMVTYGLDHLVQTSVTGTDIADNSIIAKMVDDAATADWDGYDNTTASLEALNVDTDVIIADLANGTDGLGALKTLIDTVNTDLANGTDGLGALKTLIDTVNTDLANGTDGLGALKTLLDAIKVPTDKMVFTKTNELDVNTQSINGAGVVGDGNATPWDGA